MNKSLKNYLLACEDLRDEFVKKYFKYDDSFWVGDRIGEVLSVSDHFYDMDKMVLIMQLELTEDELFDWFYWQLDFGTEGDTPPLNLEHWVKATRDKVPELQEALNKKPVNTKKEIKMAFNDAMYNDSEDERIVLIEYAEKSLAKILDRYVS